MKKILFICVENSGRSQMAEEFAKKMQGKQVWTPSVGNKPAERVNPVVVEVIKEEGIDISSNSPKLIPAKMAMEADLIVTICCNDQGVGPVPFFKPTLDWALEDLKDKPI